MPHLVIARIRSCLAIFPFQQHQNERRRDAFCAYMVETLDLCGGFIFLAGSICFLPAFSHELNIFLAGCVLFVVGGVLSASICSFSLVESVRTKGVKTFEACQNALYLVGSIFYVAGSILYWPPEAHHKGMDWLVQNMSLGVYFNLFDPEFEGTVLFIIGSIFFVLAAFVNGLDQRGHSNGSMMTATTSLYMSGSLLFVFGSVAFLPDMGCNEHIFALGAWSFVIGSVFYVAGSVISIVRTDRDLRSPDRSSLCAGPPTSGL